MKHLLIFVLALGLGLAGSPSAQEADGGYAGSFLQVPIGARPAAMGGAYIGVSDDPAGALYNPAGMSAITESVFGTSYRAMGQDRTLGYATVIFPVRGQSSLGVHWLYAGSGSVAARDGDGYMEGHDFSFNNHDFSVVFAKRFEKFLALGTKINYYQASVPEVNAFSVGFDFGAMIYIDQFYRRDRREFLTFQDTRIGLTVKYFGVEFPWVSEKYEVKYNANSNSHDQDDAIPIEVGFGASTKILDRKLLLAVDLIKNEKQGLEFHSGAEYVVNPDFALRGGWGDHRFGIGTGYRFAVGEKRLDIGYAFSSAKAGEGSEHIFSFDLNF